ncbi:phosphate/phosphite/phosphonate ABC transporter substrate-binding protein [Nonomuraea sp. SYSU D8015]|uniref:phosphate/phosphite/phosphonate ABC transporter substrate-binding protein n=1 Tax=Nonomuraea sp. SYSU D8015 TaxID=2593644 RepID=UPI00166144C1|nr:phosphate/phosphite/phosphonate ABC transporter substrate-binding protein [Nonomuraea sp. SYSU D8015]
MRPFLLALLLAVSLTTACGGAAETAVNERGLPERLRVGLIPNISPEQQRAKYEPFAAYLHRRLGVPVELFVASDYAGVVAALAGGRIDLAYLGGLTYVQGEQQVPLTPLVTEIDHDTGTPQYVSAIVVRADSPYRDLKRDVVAAGKSFAFGDVSSTSGSLYPRIMLTEAGAACSPRRVDECPPLEKVTFTGGHDATAQAVLSGQADAGGIELRILRRLEKEGKVPAGKLRVIEERCVQGYPWVMRTALGEPAGAALAEAFTSIRDPALLDLMRAKRYVTVTAADYDEVRRSAADLGLLTVEQ